MSDSSSGPSVPLRWNDPEYIEYLENLENRVTALEARVLPRTALLSDKFLTRAFAVTGYYLVAGLIIEAGVLAVWGIVFGVLALLQLLPGH